MKRLALSLVVLCAVALPAMGATNLNSSRSNIYKIVAGPTGTLQCTVDSKPCTEVQVKALAAALGKQSAIQSLTIAKDGSLLCNGTHCTSAHIPDLDSAAHAIAMRKAGGDPKSAPLPY